MSIKELAEKLGVSTCTVSLALSGKSGVSDATRKRVAEAAARLGYQPDSAARMLRSGKSLQIGVAIPAPLDDFYARMIFLLQQELTRRGFTPLFAMWGYGPDDPQRAFAQLARSKLDGLISWVDAPELTQFSCPIVVHQHTENVPLVDSVGIDYVHQIRKLLSHLLQKGCRRIGYIGNLKDAHAFILRRELQGNSLEYREEFFLRTLPKDISGFPQKFQEFSSQAELPDALVITSSQVAQNTRWLLMRQNLWHPRLISLCDSEQLALSVPPVSAFELGEQQLAFHLVELLMRRIQEPNRPKEHLLLKSKFSDREIFSEKYKQETV